jgi:tetrahydrodipicolinate N-succinyltransferase
MPRQPNFWRDFIAGLAGPAGAREAVDALDAYDTLTNLRDTDFWFDEDYKPVLRQLSAFHKMGFVTTPPELLRDGANIGRGAILTPAGLEFINRGRDIVNGQIAAGEER